MPISSAGRRRPAPYLAVGAGVFAVLLVAVVVSLTLGSPDRGTALGPTSPQGSTGQPGSGSTAGSSPADPGSTTADGRRLDPSPGASDDPAATSLPTGTPGPTAVPNPTDATPAPPTSPEPEDLTGYHWPLRNGRITAFFAPRDTGMLVVDGQRIHEGLDVTTFCGDVILAAHDGTVVAAGRRFENAMAFDGPLDDFYALKDRLKQMWMLPLVVVIDDGNGYRSAYVHLGAVKVHSGDVVSAGDVIGWEGRTGNASGCHLHYEVFRMDGPWMKVAPELVRKEHYPAFKRERIDPLRILSLHDKWAARLIPGINPPKVSPGLGRPTAP